MKLFQQPFVLLDVANLARCVINTSYMLINPCFMHVILSANGQIWADPILLCFFLLRFLYHIQPFNHLKSQVGFEESVSLVGLSKFVPLKI